MKHLKLSFFGLMLLLFCGKVQAQWVTIPQSFATYIATYIDLTAISGSQLDTTNANILGLQNLTIQAYSTPLSDITGLKYFKGLSSFSFIGFYSQFSTIVELPPNLEIVDISNVDSLSIQSFPATLTGIKLEGSCTTTLPVFPSGLKMLNLEENCISSLPLLPNSLDTLIIDKCSNIQTIGTSLPTSLKWLSAASCDIRSIPVLPANLRYFDIDSNFNLTSIDTLNGTIEYLNADITGITMLIGSIPNSLQDLRLRMTQLVSLPALPSTMAYLDISYTPIASINNLPTNCKELHLDSIPNIYQLPNWVNSCYILTASFNPQLPVSNLISNIQSWDPFPFVGATNDSLNSIPILNFAQHGSIDFSYNNISIVDSSIFTKCRSIYLSHNQINSLSSDTSTFKVITDLDLSYNNLSIINTLPIIDTANAAFYYCTLNLSNNHLSQLNAYCNFNEVDLSNNNISCLTFLSSKVLRIYIRGNPIGCITSNNSGQYGFQIDTVLPICSQGNINNCQPIGKITGRVFNDWNGNGIKDSTEPIIPNFNVYMIGNSQLYSLSSDSLGTYTFYTQMSTVDTVAVYPVDSAQNPITITTPNIIVYTAWPWQVDSLMDIGLQFLPPTPNLRYDLAVQINSYFRPVTGFDYYYLIDCENLGGQVQDGNVILNFDSTLDYQSSYPSGTVSANTISWPINNLPAGQHLPISVHFVVRATVAAGNIINSSVAANSIYPDTNLVNNYSSIYEVVTSSYDPNEKEVRPESLSQAQIDSFVYLTYTVRFQNTGTASARNIHVEDTLSQLLDLQTLKIIMASSNEYWHLEGRILKVDFPNINLPDSTTNEPLSHGFITYKIKLDSTFDNSMSIANTAYIYFDYNPPVATNTTETAKDTASITALSVTTSYVNSILCHGGNDGATGINVSGGSPSYYYDWSNGGHSNSIANLSPGNYSVTVYDNSGDSVITTIIITEPTILNVAASVTRFTDANQNNGSIDVNASGATPPYRYYLSNGDSSLTGHFTGLGEGCYSVTTSDAAKCVAVVDSLCVSAYAGINGINISSNNLQLYPNPTNGQLNIHWTGGGATGLLRMEVVNTLGQTVDRFTVTGNATYKLSVKNYASGVYLLHCYTDGHQQASSQRFVVEH